MAPPEVFDAAPEFGSYRYHGAGYQPPDATGTMFLDVAASHGFAKWIEQLTREGITDGCGATKYCPEATATRGQMAAFLVRAFTLPM